MGSVRTLCRPHNVAAALAAQGQLGQVARVFPADYEQGENGRDLFVCCLSHGPPRHRLEAPWPRVSQRQLQVLVKVKDCRGSDLQPAGGPRR